MSNNPPNGGSIHQINVSGGGVPKQPVEIVEVTRNGLVGDTQAKLGVHGGIYKAVSLYSLECLLALQHEGHPVSPGALGENLTVAGMDWARVVPGVELRLGESVRLKITMFAVPCVQIAPGFHDGEFARVHHRKHPGWSRVYAEVLDVGILNAGDAVVVAD